ncbi:MAG: N-acetylglucosamine kinase [Anaerolineaceae bacterium]
MTLNQNFFLGADIGGTKTRLLISDQTGRILGFGQAGPGNHEVVGYDGFTRALRQALGQALPADIQIEDIAGAGLGVGGLDFPSEMEDTMRAVSALGLKCPVIAVNDAVIGLVAGSPQGWGIALVSGTGCNCRGMDASRLRTGQVTGHGTRMGEGAGASELIDETIKVLARQWTGRIPRTQLGQVFTEYCGAADLGDLIEGLINERYTIGPEAAPLIFEAANHGDEAAAGLIDWAGRELGQLATAVIRQLEFQGLDFDVVMTGSMFDGGRRLIEPMQRTILQTAPGARFIRLAIPPVIGAVLLGMEAAGMPATMDIRTTLEKSMRLFLSE